MQKNSCNTLPNDREILSTLITTGLPLNDDSWTKFIQDGEPTNLLKELANKHNSQGEIPLYEGFKMLNTHVVKLLLSAGANPMIKNADGSPCGFGIRHYINNTFGFDVLEQYLYGNNDSQCKIIDQLVNDFLAETQFAIYCSVTLLPDFEQNSIYSQMGISKDDLSKLPSKPDFRKIDDIIFGPALQEKKYYSISIINSSIDDEIKNNSNGGNFFVLPSQLNGAEYPDPHHLAIVTSIDEYHYDRTAGPIAQLCVNPIIGQFILNNAENTYNPSGINAAKFLLDKVNKNIDEQYHLSVQNGYLVVPKISDKEIENQIITNLKENIAEFITLAMLDCPVVNSDHIVNLVYASAIPVLAYTNIVETDDDYQYLRSVANIFLIAGYYGSLKLALTNSISLNKRTKVFLLPLGGGVFNNNPQDIVESIKYSIDNLIDNHGFDQVFNFLDITLLTWKGSNKELNTYSGLIQSIF